MLIEDALPRRQGQYHPWVSGWPVQGTRLRFQIADLSREAESAIRNLKSEITNLKSPRGVSWCQEQPILDLCPRQLRFVYLQPGPIHRRVGRASGGSPQRPGHGE